MNKKTHNKQSFQYTNTQHLIRYGIYGIKVSSLILLTESQLNSIEWDLIKKLKLITKKKPYKFWNCVTLNINLTKLNIESRMGKGKGLIYTKGVFLKPGTILFEFDNITLQQIVYLYNYINKKISNKFILVFKNY
uniref:Ribosomal protein L16 n=1 Tax=Plocamiocolax pulvinatus TaxID=35206 RepID=E5Q3F0_9FLOR|nr:ribosomal protein L16 [Plocamiocolax pulvinata]ADR03233.1 ribosomal protein L16 [Plocamiocolax pulvinata]